eukprot:GEMP01007422.1.p1 GENE.GEMP01007422.1~~GEMP01007422.1.p1  ORF type:complete len:548 (+),score=161.27 GEMP01007422.1:109-1752(+)
MNVSPAAWNDNCYWKSLLEGPVRPENGAGALAAAPGSLLSTRSFVEEVERRKNTTVAPVDVFFEDHLIFDLRKSVRARMRQPEPQVMPEWCSGELRFNDVLDAEQSLREHASVAREKKRRIEQKVDEDLERTLADLRRIQQQQHAQNLYEAQRQWEETQRQQQLAEEAQRQQQQHLAQQEAARQEAARQEAARLEAELQAQQQAQLQAQQQAQLQAQQQAQQRSPNDAHHPSAASNAIPTPTPPSQALPARSTDFVKASEEDMRKVDEHVAALQAFLQDRSRKSERLQMQKALNIRIGQISAQRRTIETAVYEISLLFTQLQSGSNPELLACAEWKCADLLADSSLNIQAKSDAQDSWPVSHVCARLFAKYPSVYDLFRGIMYKSCRYLVPHYAEYCADAAQYCLSRGQKDGEDEEAFLKRMVGYMRLWFGIMVLRQDFTKLWQWWTRILNQKARRETPSLIVVALEISGESMQQRFGRQWKKLVGCIQHQFLPSAGELQKKQPALISAVIPRVEKWVADYNAGRRCPPPPGKDIQAVEESALRSDV